MLNILLRKMYALLNIFLWKMYAKMHFCIKCICNILCYKMYASNAFLHSWTFSFGKCTPKYICNILCNKMWCWTFSFGKCTRCVAKMHLMRCKNAFVTFCVTKCDAEHFPLENVMLNILQSQMWCWTFSKGKCDALRCKNAFLHQMHFCIKCIFATHQMHL